MNILILTPSVTDTCSFYRSGGIAPDLVKRFDINIRVAQWDKIILTWQNMITYDLVMMQRPFRAEAVNLADYLKHLKIPVWIDYDDNLFVVPPENPQFKIYDAEARENIKRLLQLADIVTVTTNALKESLKQFNPNIRVIPNAFNDFIFKEKNIQDILKQPRSRLVAWRGGLSHVFDIMSLANPINKAVKDFSDWQFLFLGYNPWHLTEANNMFTLDAMDVMVYFRHVKRMAPIMLQVPLFTSLFNKCKSNIAYIEGAYFGAVTLAPDWEVWDVPGIIHYSNEEEYYNGIRAVLKGEVNVEATVRMAWEYILDELSLTKINVKRMEIIKELTS